jgi:hypothetical protein
LVFRDKNFEGCREMIHALTGKATLNLGKHRFYKPFFPMFALKLPLCRIPIIIFNTDFYFFMNYSRLTKEEILHQARLRINNSLGDDVIKNAVAGMGYTEEKLNEGKNLLNDSATFYENQLKEYGDVDAAQDKLKTSRKVVYGNYITMLTIARIAFKKNMQAISTLELTGTRAASLSGWLSQARNFYNALLANDAWKAVMAGYGQTEEKLTEALEDVNGVAEASENVKKEMGDAQNATQMRDMKFDELTEWLSDYDQIAEIALADKPQLLEKIGIVVKS